jgi:CBS domain-containing protein
MQVSVLLQTKGSEVVTVAPDRPVREVLAVLAEHGIGAVVVAAGERSIAGIVSERDVVRALARVEDGALDLAASDLMATDVVTCEPDTTVDHLMAVMTERRVRHVPVVVDGELVGLVSIGDVVKHHIATLEHETKAMQDYIANPF